MTNSTISQRRLKNQNVAHSDFSSVKELVAHLGAIQAQDFRMAKWAIGSRVKNATLQTVEAAIDRGEIFRTHILRPTWHFVSADDIRWMLALTAPRILNGVKSRHRQLKITPSDIKQANNLFEKILTNGNHLTRDELQVVLKENDISIEKNRGYHLIFSAQMNGILANGQVKNGKHTYALFEERVPTAQSLTEEEAIYRLAKKYFTSHAPATFLDFHWWSGLTKKQARKGFESVKPEFEVMVYEEEEFLIHDEAFTEKANIFLLPAYDEFNISYNKKDFSLPFKEHKKLVQNIGIFRPTIVENGNIIGIWKAQFKSKKIIFETTLFKESHLKLISSIIAKMKYISHFYAKECIIKYDLVEKN